MRVIYAHVIADHAAAYFPAFIQLTLRFSWGLRSFNCHFHHHASLPHEHGHGHKVEHEQYSRCCLHRKHCWSDASLYSQNSFGIGSNHDIVIQLVWNNYTANIYLFQRESSRSMAIQAFGAHNNFIPFKDVHTRNFLKIAFLWFVIFLMSLLIFYF